MPNRAHLPTNLRSILAHNEGSQVLHLLKNTNHARFCLVENDVVDLIVAVHETAPVFWLRLGVTKECDHLVLVWDLAHRHPGVLVDRGALCLRDGVKRFDLAGVEAGCFSIALESYVFGDYSVEFG
jgi:hypothetical protein